MVHDEMYVQPQAPPTYAHHRCGAAVTSTDAHIPERRNDGFGLHKRFHLLLLCSLWHYGAPAHWQYISSFLPFHHHDLSYRTSTGDCRSILAMGVDLYFIFCCLGWEVFSLCLEKTKRVDFTNCKNIKIYCVKIWVVVDVSLTLTDMPCVKLMTDVAIALPHNFPYRGSSISSYDTNIQIHWRKMVQASLKSNCLHGNGAGGLCDLWNNISYLSANQLDTSCLGNIFLLTKFSCRFTWTNWNFFSCIILEGVCGEFGAETCIINTYT